MRGQSLTFNIAAYTRQLLSDFHKAGGKTVIREFRSPQELACLDERVIVNCPGYGARSLWSDQSIIPIRGQIAWLAPNEGHHYGLMYNNLFVLARRDGIVLQYTRGGGMEGWNDSNEEPDYAVAAESVEVLRQLYNRMAEKKQRV